MYQQRRRIGGAKPKRYGANSRASSRGTRVSASSYSRALKRPAASVSTGVPVELKSNDQSIHALFKYAANSVNTNVPYAAPPNNFVSAQSCHIHSIKRGTSSYNRIGRQVRLVSLHGKYFLELEGNTSGKPHTARVMFVLDRYPRSGTAATFNVVPYITDVLDLTTGQDNNVNGDAPYAFQNLSNTNRFRILHDKTIALNRSNYMKYQHGTVGAEVVAEAGSNEGYFVEFNVKINESAKYKEDADEGDYDKTDQGALIMLLINNNPTTGAEIRGSTRLRYTDA